MNRITPLILAVALFMEMMDSTVIATSLPAIAADIGTEPIALKLAMTAYLVALAIFIPVSGWMADRFGARNVFRAAIFVFMLGSLACAVADSLGFFVASRFVQGMGGSMMTPLARLVLVRSTPKEKLVAAMSWLTMPALTGPLLGPPIGGFLTTFLSWHWIFLINIPIGVIGIIAATIFLPRTGYRDRRAIDWRGFLLAGGSFSGMLFGLSVISLPALPPEVGVVTLIVGVASGIGYLWHARRTENPLLNPALFQHRLFRIATTGAFIFRVGMGATPFLLPLMLQLGFGLTPFETGLIMLFGAVGAIVAKFTAPAVFANFGFRHVMLTTAALSAAGLATKGFFNPMTPTWMMMALLLSIGLVRSTFFTGVNAMSFGDVPNEEAAQATAVFAVATQLSLALGVAVAGSILEAIVFLRGAPLAVSDYQTAFFIVGGIALTGIIPFLRLGSNEGADISGHGTAKARTEHITPPGE